MLKQLLFIGAIGLSFIKGDCIDGRIKRIVEDSSVEISENRDINPLVPIGTEFKGYGVDIYNGVGVYKGPDNLYYKVKYNIFSKTLVVEEVSDEEIEF